MSELNWRTGSWFNSDYSEVFVPFLPSIHWQHSSWHGIGHSGLFDTLC